VPIIENIVGQDTLTGARDGGKILLSALGDDAVSLGAVAAARRLVGRDPFKKQFRVKPNYPEISRFVFGEISVGQKSYDHDIFIPVNGKVKNRKQDTIEESSGSAHLVGAKELERVCRGGPEVLFLGAGENTDDARRYLAQRSIKLDIAPTAKAVENYNKSKSRKAILAHVTC
jgi:hypothetical protein